MDFAKIDEVSEIGIRLCNCYKASNLEKTILDSNETGDFEDRYVLRAQLGWGKFGIIRACTDKLTGEVLACKSIAKERLVTEDDVRSVKLEIEIMTRLSGHPNVVDLKAVYEEENDVHLLMELCAGGELFHLIEKRGRFSEYEACVLFRQLMEVVSYCHDNGIVHRDLKPENILLVSRSSSSPIKLADFGLATYITPGQELKGTVGSPFYIAPEVLAGGYNQSADVWSAGVILYILLSGMPPFWGRTKSKIFDAVRIADLRFHPDLWDHISASAKDLITRMLCVDPSQRFTANQVLAHSWMKHSVEEAQDHREQESLDSQDIKVESCSFITPVIVRNQDYSFTEEGSPKTADRKGENSPVFTCRSSFSSFMVDHETPCSVSGGFSFGSCCESTTPEFSSPIPSMLSFTFFSPGPALEPSSKPLGYKEKTSSIDEDSNLGKRFLFPDPSEPVEHKLVEVEQRTEFRRGGLKNGSKTSSMSSKRNHTIGLGELDQLDLISTESVIRWASCTRIPSPASLISSLVC